MVSKKCTDEILKGRDEPKVFSTRIEFFKVVQLLSIFLSILKFILKSIFYLNLRMEIEKKSTALIDLNQQNCFSKQYIIA